MDKLFEYEIEIAGERAYIYGRDDEVVALTFGNNKALRARLERDFAISNGSESDEINIALKRYAQTGELKGLEPRLLWGTPFQKAVWGIVSAIPMGETITYGEIADKIGKPKACRAVGRAVGTNPIPILISCHRVRAKNGPGGYLFGLDLKRKLLEIEGIELK